MSKKQGRDSQKVAVSYEERLYGVPKDKVAFAKHSHLPRHTGLKCGNRPIVKEEKRGVGPT